MADRNVLLIAKLKKAYSKKPNPILADEIKKLETKIEKGKTAGPGDPISKRAARESMLTKGKPKVFDPTGVLGMKMPKKKKKDVGDWEAGEEVSMGMSDFDPDQFDYAHGIADYTIESRRGGQIKKPKKKAKAKPRKVKAKTRQVTKKPKGVGVALRGYRRSV